MASLGKNKSLFSFNDFGEIHQHLSNQKLTQPESLSRESRSAILIHTLKALIDFAELLIHVHFKDIEN